MLKKDSFRHFYTTGLSARSYEDCRTTIVTIIFNKYNPSTKSGLNSLKVKFL